MGVDKVTDEVANMMVNMVADMEMDKVVNMLVDMVLTRNLTWWSSVCVTRLELPKGVKYKLKQARRAQSRPVEPPARSWGQRAHRLLICFL